MCKRLCKRRSALTCSPPGSGARRPRWPDAFVFFFALSAFPGAYAAEAAPESPPPVLGPIVGLPATPPPTTANDDAAEVPLEQAGADPASALEQIQAQIQAREYQPAIDDLRKRIDAIEQNSYGYDPRLVRPLTLLGDAEVGLGEYQTALEDYQRAVHLSRVNKGLNTPDQVDIVYREADAWKALGDYQQANDREEYAYYVLNQAHADDDEQLLPGIYHLAKWYESTSNVFAARALYQQAVDIIDAHHELGSLEAIPALKGLAASYRMERFPPYYLTDSDTSETNVVRVNTVQQTITVNNFSEGEAALQRIVRIREAQQQDDPVAVAKAVLDLADWYTLFDKQSRADTLYAHAWDLMKGAKGFDVAGYFSKPQLLYFPAPGNPSPPPPDKRGERTTGYVEVAFDVTEDGNVRNLTTVASQPAGLMDFRVRRSLRLARYRPMLVDGVPVATEKHTYRHEFPYYPELDNQPKTASAASGD